MVAWVCLLLKGKKRRERRHRSAFLQSVPDLVQATVPNGEDSRAQQRLSFTAPLPLKVREEERKDGQPVVAGGPTCVQHMVGM